MSTVKASDFPRRSLLHHRLAAQGAVFEPLGEGAVVTHFGDERAEATQAKSLALADLSVLARTGFKGSGTPEWLKAQGVAIPAAPNQALTHGAGLLVGALSWDEHLLLSALTGDNGECARLDAAWQSAPAGRCYRLARADSHAWLALSGVHAAALLATLCGVDLRLDRFANGRIAQTSLARLSAVIIRADLGATPAFYLLADSAAVDYLWTCLTEAMTQFHAQPVGIGALRELLME